MAPTTGKWRWEANTTGHQIRLVTGNSDTVMDFVRYGMRMGQPRFNTDGLMVKAETLFFRPQEHNPWRVTDILHRDAHLIAAAPDLLAALKLAAELVKTARQHFPVSMHDSDRFELENTNATICAAIAKAQGGVASVRQNGWASSGSSR